jgi:hypothetical protein
LIDTRVNYYPNRLEMPSNRQIAADWGVTPSYVDRMVKRGCPTDTFENARLWLAANTKRSRVCMRKAEGLGSQDPSKKGSQDPFISDNLEDSLAGIKKAVHESGKLLDEALMEQKTTKIGAWISLHTRAVEARVRAEASMREELERQKILIPLSEAQAMARKGYQIILQRLSALPQNLSAKLNPADPAWAMDVLQQEVAGIISDARQAFAESG